MAELRVIRARTESQVYQLLSAAQKKQLETLAAQEPPRPHGRGGADQTPAAGV